jgi:hypothetical protein
MDYSVRFTVAQGVDGLAAGSDVKVGGLLKGMVTEISPQFTKNQSETEQLESIIVKFQVDSDVTLWSNASVTRYMPLLGGGAWLNFDSVGFPKSNDDKGGDLLKQNGELTANVTGGILATLLGPSDAERTSKALQNIDKFTAFLTDIPKSWNEEVVPMLENVNSMTASIRKDYVEWSKKITLFLTHADSAALKIDDTLDDIPPLLVSAQKDLDQVGEILDENATKISETMDNIVVMTQDGKVFISDFRTESLVKINQILETGEKGIDSLTNSLNRIDTEITVRMPDISMMLANLRQASAQLKLTALEVRRSPWKLLYTPSTTEVAHENLYESARSFVMATNELESASLAFREIFEINPEMLESQPELKAEVEKYVFDALDRFKKAQERLFSEIVDQK